MKILLSIVILVNFLSAYEIEHFLFPNDRKIAEKSILKAISDAKESIDIAMFMVTNGKIVKALKKKAKGKDSVKIRLIADESYDKENKKISKVKKLTGSKNIKLFLIHGKKKSKKSKEKFGIMHSKLMIVDNNMTYTGSVNWTKSAFNYNYEILIKIKDLKTAKLYTGYFNEMLEKSIAYGKK